MAYLIDGNNLIGHIPHLILGDPESRHQLISKLLVFQKVSLTRIILVFDGPPDFSLQDRVLSASRFSVHFPAFEQNADSVIKEILSKQTDLRQFYLVSSDRELIKYARSKKANPINRKNFNRKLNEAKKVYKKTAEMEKTSPLPTPFEVKHWTTIFRRKK